VDLNDWFRYAVGTTGELDYADAFDWFGLAFRDTMKVERKPCLGVETRVDNGRLLITRIPRGAPVEHSGLSVDDEIIAIDDFRVRAEKFEKHLENHAPGERVSVLVARRDRLARFETTLGEQPKKWRLELREDLTAIQKEHLERWLSGTAFSPASCEH
jgi:predicted metalloprotease with PDZ domain